MSQKNKIKNSTRTYKDSILLLKRLFAQYSFKDIAESLLASELWLPNRASGIKHKFTWGVLASMNEDDFSNKKQTSSKSDFIAFLQTLYSLLPEFPMLEDFTPQPDWGDIRVTFNGHTKSVFYGAEIERITDFINAFEIRYYSCTSILKDMENALKTQSLFLNTIDKNIAGSTKYIEPGHLSVPTFEFKTSILKSIKIINQNQQVQKSAEKYSTSLSTFALPKRGSRDFPL